MSVQASNQAFARKLTFWSIPTSQIYGFLCETIYIGISSQTTMLCGEECDGPNALQLLTLRNGIIIEVFAVSFVLCCCLACIQLEKRKEYLSGSQANWLGFRVAVLSRIGVAIYIVVDLRAPLSLFPFYLITTIVLMLLLSLAIPDIVVGSTFWLLHRQFYGAGA